MSRVPMDQEQNTAPEEFSVRDILADFRAQEREEPIPAPAPRYSVSPAALQALQAEEEPEDGVRIYRPRKDRDRAQEEARLAARWDEPILPEEELPPQAEAEDEPEEELPPTVGSRIADFFARLTRDRAPVEEPEPVPPRELPSFEELIWGEEKRKSAPVRIVEDGPVTSPAPQRAEAPAEVEITIPEEELAGLSVGAILSGSWSGFSEEAAQPLPRRARPEPERPAPLAEEEAVSYSVSDILSDFWASYTEPEEAPAPRDGAPRSRREAARLRGEGSPVPPTGAAPSAAANKRSAPRRLRDESARRPAVSGDDDEEERPAPRRDRRRARQVQETPELPPERERETAPTAPPAPVDAAEPAALFGFLRRQQDPPAPSPARPPQPKEITDEDVEFGTMSVDDILAEYNDIFAALPAAAAAIGAERDAEAAEAPPALPAETPGAPKGNVSRMEAEARGILEQMRSGSLTAPAPEAPKTEAPAPEKAPAAMPSVADREWNGSLRRLLGQDPAPPQPATAAEPSRSQPERVTAPRRSAIPSEEVDPRFNLSGQRKSTMVFGDRELDLSADESYVPPKAADNVGFHWVAGEEELPDKPLEKKALFRRRRKEEPQPKAETADDEELRSEGFDDRKRPEYAPDEDYEDPEDEGPGAFPSFGQYLSGMVSGLLVRLLGVRHSRGGDAAGTMEDEDEDLGPEVSPAAASKYYGSFVLSLRMRLRIGLALLLVMAWIALGLPVSGALRSAQVAAGMALAIQLTILLLGLDVVTGAAVNLARGRFGADSLAVLCCVLTSLDALSVCLGALGTAHMPLCLISSASFLGVLLSSLVSARGLRKALRVPAIGKRCYGVTAEAEVKGRGLTLLKSLRPAKGFVRRTEEAAPDETLFLRLAPLLGLLALLLAFIVAIAKHAFGEFLYILTALLCPAVPLTALLAFALPYFFGSLRIFHSGAAIAGWSGVSEIGRSENLIVTDRDLFPEGSVEIDTVRIFAEVQPETVISYAGTMVCASGSDLAPCFAELMEKNGCPMRRVEGFEYLAGGGMKGVIDGSVILCGGLDLMRLMNVRVPYRLVGKTTVLLAVDGILCGIFNMKYEGQPQVRKALVGLIRSNRHPIFAIRDFLVTPEMLSDCFDVATDGYDFPPYVDRFAISEAKPSAGSKLAAVVCREGLGPLAHMADTGRSVYVATRLNLLLTVLAAVIGVLVCFFRLLSAGTVSTGFLLVFLLLWALPVAVISVFLRL